MPVIVIKSVSERKGSGYPPPFNESAMGRVKQALGDAGGLNDFGVNLTRLPPGAWSSQRHWHSAEEEFVYLLEGELTLVTDGGEQVLRAGECAAFPKNEANGHHFINRSNAMAVYLEVGTRSGDDVCTYPDVDLHIDGKQGWYTHRDGTFYPKPKIG